MHTHNDKGIAQNKSFYMHESGILLFDYFIVYIFANLGVMLLNTSKPSTSPPLLRKPISLI